MILSLAVAGAGLWYALTMADAKPGMLPTTVTFKTHFKQTKTSGWTDHGVVKTRQVEGHNVSNATYTVNGAVYPYEISIFEATSSAPITIYYDPENPKIYQNRPPTTINFPRLLALSVSIFGVVGCLLCMGIGGTWLLIRHEVPSSSTVVEEHVQLTTLSQSRSR